MNGKTQAMRLLEGKGAKYEVYEYPTSERDAESIAQLLGLPAGQVFKTLVIVRQSKKPMLVMIPSDRSLNLKKLARIAGEKKVKMASHREAERLTGLQVGGISALALLNRGFVVYLDRSAEEFGAICVSAGRRGLQLKVGVDDLSRITGASIVDVVD